jgi:hypothetical protein
MIGDYWAVALTCAVFLLAAVPFVARIRHPDQKPFAAYLIFVTVLTASFAVTLGLLIWLAGLMGIEERLQATAPAVVLIVAALLPAFAIATWQARRPPMRP